MELFTRRLIAVAATSALVSVPAVGLVGNGGWASAASTTSGTARAAASCRVATPAGLFDGLIGGVLNSLSGTGGTGGLGAATDPVTELAGILTGGGDPTAVLDQVTGLLSDSGADANLLSSLTSLGDPTALLDQLTGALPIGAVFADGLPTELTSLLGGSTPSTISDLVAQLTAALTARGATSVPAAVAGKLPPSVLTAVNDALSRSASAPAKTGTAGTSGTCGVPPTTACRNATTKVKALQKRWKSAKHQHHRAQAKALSTKLKHAKKAKKKAC